MPSSSIKEVITYRLKLLLYSFNRFYRKVTNVSSFISKSLGAISILSAIMCLVCLIVFIGFNHTPEMEINIRKSLVISQWIYAVNIIFNLVFNLRDTIKETRVIKWIVDIAIIITLFPYIFPEAQYAWLQSFDHLLYSNRFLYPVLAAYSIVTISYGVIKLMGRHTNPSLILSGSFLFFILLGSILLMLPNCTVSGIKYTDSLFLSTSAVCITGLTPIDIASTLTPLGLLILAILMQIGGLGVMTFTSFFALFFSGNTSIHSQLMVKDMFYSKTINSLLPTLLYILGFTLAIEAVGAACIFMNIHGTLGLSLNDEIIFSAFHAVSAFCNAGFSNLSGGLSNPALLNGNQAIYITASLLIIAGGIGFPLLVNMKEIFSRNIKRLINKMRRRKERNIMVHVYDMNTKIVLVTTIGLISAGTIVFFILEYNNALAGMSLYDKIIQSFFNAVTPRSAGFSSINPNGFSNVTILIIILLMWIGGGSQSTAGGIKVNTFATMLLSLRATITGKQNVSAFSRNISTASIKRANAVISMSILTYFIYAVTLVALEPQLPVKGLLYEAASALFTVGSSLGITSQLSEISKILLCTAMFLGRVGIISLLVGLSGKHRDSSIHYPSDNIIIN